MMKPFNKFMATVVICSLLSPPGYSVMNPLNAPVVFDKKILATSAPEESEQKVLVMSSPDEEGQKILVMSSPDDEGQKIIAMISSSDEGQRVLITSVPEETQQRIIAMVLPEGFLKTPEIIAFNGLFRGFNILGFKGLEDTSLLKILTKKSQKDTDLEENETTLIETEEGKIKVSIMDMDQEWWDNHLEGLAPTTVEKETSEIQWQMELLDEGETMIQVRDIPDSERTHPISIGETFVDRKTGEKMQLYFYRKNEDGEQRATLKIENPDGTVREHKFVVPLDERLRKEIVLNRTNIINGTNNGLIIATIIIGSGSGIATILGLGLGISDIIFDRIKLGSIATFLGGSGGIIGTAVMINQGAKGNVVDFLEKIYSKKYENYIENLSNNDQNKNEKKISHKTFVTLKNIFTGLSDLPKRHTH